MCYTAKLLSNYLIFIAGEFQRWRDDGRCGTDHRLPDDTPGQCDPEGNRPCCNSTGNGRCGNTAEHCSCDRCTNFTRLYRDWEKSGGTQKWRYDGKCGSYFPLPDGTPSECDPDGDKPCCSSDWNGECGNTAEHCSCDRCTNYTRLYRDWEKSGGTQKWRYDGKCGSYFPLPDGTPSECDPDGDKPCCSMYKGCGNYEVMCVLSDCVDYRVVREIRKSGKNCTVTKIRSGFLKHVCFDEDRRKQYYRCVHHDGDNTVSYDGCYELNHQRTISHVCKNDQHAYQACGFFTKITNSDVLCGGYFCGQQSWYGAHRYIDCRGDDCKPENRDCAPSPRNDTTLCNDICDDYIDCKDESFCKCNGYQYGVNCDTWWGGERYVPVHRVCDGYEHCDYGSDEKNCNVSDSSVHTCTHYWKNVTVPIHNYTRCSVFDVSNEEYPYCSNYLDQTNCSDIERVGGYCEVNGYMSTVSKYMLCRETDKKTGMTIKLCEDDIQKECVSLKADCTINKHKMCDDVQDCSDGSDEVDDMCDKMSDKFNFTCTRRFQLKRGEASIPVSWIKDGVTDCMRGEEESEWTFCSDKKKQMISPGKKCENFFKCPGDEMAYVFFDQLCDGIESECGGAENEVCKIARDFPSIDKNSKQIENSTVRDVCTITGSTDCEIKEYIKPWGAVFGEKKVKLSVPTAKVNCSRLFGENYLYLSCMDLCLEADAKCPLEAGNRKLEYNSCPGQFPNRSYTLANNSFLTFVEKSDSGQYHQDFYKCNNSRCLEYNQVCDLVDDCGDMSDELNCGNHMICQNTKNEKRHQFISLSQKCDGIYDCFDLSDECNNDCNNRKEILRNWFIKMMCWFQGMLAMFLNCFIMVRGINSLRLCETENLMISKVLMTLVAFGDFLIGLYMVLLSVYDSIILGEEFCRNQADWLTGTPCLLLGVISTLGSQISLFTMTVLSVIRMYGLTFKSLRVPGPINRKSIMRVVSIATLIMIAASAAAITPLVPSLEDLFVQGMYYDPAYKVFIGFPNKERHVDVLKAYYNPSRTSNVSLFTKDMSWKEIGELVDGMFTADQGKLTRQPVHFYGNDGVCMFKYFVRTDDARRSRKTSENKYTQNDPVVWTMLIVNFLCFVIISVCYMKIAYETRKSSKRSGQQDNPERLREERAIQRKILIIIATDFLCWVPFIAISALHYLQQIDASDWYVTFAMLVLPLNSVINPLVYDTALAELIRGKFEELYGVARQGILSAMSRLPPLNRENYSGQEVETIEMDLVDAST